MRTLPVEDQPTTGSQRINDLPVVYQKDVRQECSNNATRHKTDVYCKIADCANLCTIIAYAKVIDYELQIFESPSTTS